MSPLLKSHKNAPDVACSCSSLFALLGISMCGVAKDKNSTDNGDHAKRKDKQIVMRIVNLLFNNG